MNGFGEIPLRSRKFARTKVGLLQAAMARLDACTLEELQVRDLCDAVQISQASFFNYFPRKSDLLVYFVQMWSIEVAWHVLVADSRPLSARAAIAHIFELTAKQAAEHPGVLAEVMAEQARLREPPKLIEITLAERLLAFPDMPGIDTAPARGLDSLLPELLRRAVKQGELPKSTKIDDAFLGLSALFFGIPMILRRIDPRSVGPAYRAQFDLYWTGLVATTLPSMRAGSRSSARKKLR
jgi:AcrR family transcriptional regulator